MKLSDFFARLAMTIFVIFVPILLIILIKGNKLDIGFLVSIGGLFGFCIIASVVCWIWENPD